MPLVLVHVAIGIIAGPQLFGWLTLNPAIELLGIIAVVLLLGTTGLKMTMEELWSAGWNGLWVAILGILVSFGAGHFISALWGSPHPEAMYVGIALTATSIGISVQILSQYGLIQRKIGQIVIAAALIDDVIALYLLAATHEALIGILTPLRVLSSLAGALLLLIAIFVISRFVARLLKRSRLHENRFGILLTFAITMTISAMLAHSLGFSAVAGAFSSGIGFGGGLGAKRQSVSVLLEFPALLLLPLFFIPIGMRADWQSVNGPGALVLLIGLVSVAVVGKAVGGYIGARGLDKSSRTLVGLSMMPRGEVALIIITTGLLQGHVTNQVFVVVMLAITVVTLLGAFAVMAVARKAVPD